MKNVLRYTNSYPSSKTTTTEKAANSAIRKGLHQIEENPGGIILYYENQEISEEELLKVINKRMAWCTLKNVDIMYIIKGVAKIVRFSR